MQVNLSKPLCAKIEIMAKGRRGWQHFKYETIPILCFLRERIGHLEDAYLMLKGKAELSDEKVEKLYGLWIIVSRVLVKARNGTNLSHKLNWLVHKRTKPWIGKQLLL